MPTRRLLLAGLAASVLPVAGWASVGNPLWLAAAQEPGGGFALFGLDADLARTFRVPLPARGHAAAGHPTQPVAVAFARRPGTFAMVIDCATGAVRVRLEAPAGRHFYGHGAYLADGTILATTENAYATGEGRIGLWDATRGYVRIGEVASGGIGPHEVVRLPGTDVLVVANGGIRTHPDTDREKLNLDTMRPNLAYLDVDGRLLDVLEPPPDLRQASIRHLAARADGTVVAALQWEGPADRVVPLVALHRRGESGLRLLSDEPEQQARMVGYGGSASWSQDGAHVAVTGPRGGLAQIWTPATGALRRIERADICGAAPGPGGFLFTDGHGGMGNAERVRASVALNWDNHLVPL